MAKLSDIRIGTKLSIMSGLGVLLVASMIFVQMKGNGTSRAANEGASFQEEIARDVMAAKAAERAVQVAGRDVRLARSSQDLEGALKRLEDRQKEAHRWIDPLAGKMRLPENRVRAERIKDLIDQFVAGLRDIGKVKAQAVDLISRPSAGDAAARIVELDAEAARIARERTLPWWQRPKS